MTECSHGVKGNQSCLACLSEAISKAGKAKRRNSNKDALKAELMTLVQAAVAELTVAEIKDLIRRFKDLGPLWKWTGIVLLSK